MKLAYFDQAKYPDILRFAIFWLKLRSGLFLPDSSKITPKLESVKPEQTPKQLHRQPYRQSSQAFPYHSPPWFPHAKAPPNAS